MTAEENKIFEDALLLQKTTAWWINNSTKILQQIDDLENEPYSLENEEKLNHLYQNLGVFLAKKKLEENKIDEILTRIDKIKDKNAKT